MHSCTALATVCLFVLVYSVSNGSTLVPKSSIISSQVGTQSGDSEALLEDPVEINFILVRKILFSGCLPGSLLVQGM